MNGQGGMEEGEMEAPTISNSGRSSGDCGKPMLVKPAPALYRCPRTTAVPSLA
jgi:hypothetical protein